MLDPIPLLAVSPSLSFPSEVKGDSNPPLPIKSSDPPVPTPDIAHLFLAWLQQVNGREG